MQLRKLTTCAARRKVLEKELKLTLENIGSFTLDESVAGSRNCENMIGAVQIPLGIAGPLKISNYKLKINEFYLPLATTEGALVASVNRGCKAINESGGAMVDSYRVGATRGPVFLVKDLKESDRLNQFLGKHFSELVKVAASTSGHLTLQKYFSRGVGRYRYVRFVFDTMDAMGLNMVTIATDALVDYIQAKTGIPCLALSGNYCVDKKPSWLNFIEGRGIKTWAEVVIPATVLNKVLKTTAKKIYDVWLAKCMLGSAMSGSLSFNAQYANILAAIFAATGQDLAHLSESSIGITTCEAIAEKLFISVYLPDLMIGTVGGGTGLVTQKEALEILGVAGGNNGKNSQKFAEIIGAAVLAGEISLLASLSEGTLARAHQRLARGK